MKYLIILIFTNTMLSQTLNVTCEGQDIIETRTHHLYETVSFEDCGATLLMQDSSTIKIFAVNGVGFISRGGVATAPTINGIDRFVGDENPQVTFIGCEEDFTNIIIGQNIDVNFLDTDCYD